MVDAAQGTIPVRPTTVWLYKNIAYAKEGVKIAGGKRKSPTHTASTQPLWPDPLQYSGGFKKAESGPVQGATVNRRLVEPTNSASVDTIYSNLGIVKKILWLLYAERKENPDTAKADHSA